MTRAELRSLVVGDRVRWVTLYDDMTGTVDQKFRGVVRIAWDHGATRMHLNHMSRYDRTRALHLTKLPKPAPELQVVQTEQSGALGL